MVNIVLIEDNPQSAHLICKVLALQGYEVTHAMDALTGIWQVENIQPDLVLLDMDLPDMQGDKVAQRLSYLSHTRHIPIIAVTASTSIDMQYLAITSGCQEVIHKPINTRTLSDQISHFLPALLA